MGFSMPSNISLNTVLQSTAQIARGAMVVVTGNSGAGAPGVLDECPIIQRWLQLEDVVARAAKGKIALCRSADMDRSTVCDNYELLIPLVQEYGSFGAV